MVELLVVTAIIGLLANRATVKTMGALYKGRRAGVTLYVHAVKSACLTHYIDRGNYPVCSSPPCYFGGKDLSEYLKDEDYLDHTFSQAHRSWGNSNEPMLFAYQSDGRFYEFLICFNGIGSSYLEEQCVAVKDEGSIRYEDDPPPWAS